MSLCLASIRSSVVSPSRTQWAYHSLRASSVWSIGPIRCFRTRGVFKGWISQAMDRAISRTASAVVRVLGDQARYRIHGVQPLNQGDGLPDKHLRQSQRRGPTARPVSPRNSSPNCSPVLRFTPRVALWPRHLSGSSRSATGKMPKKTENHVASLLRYLGPS